MGINVEYWVQEEGWLVDGDECINGTVLLWQRAETTLCKSEDVSIVGVRQGVPAITGPNPTRNGDGRLTLAAGC
jgi:hypothetical protein